MKSNEVRILHTNPETGGFLLHRPISTTSRLIIPFTPRNWCSPGVGISFEDRALPSELKELGVQEEEWNFFMQKLDQEVQPFATNKSKKYLYWVLCLAGFFCCLKESESIYQKKVEIWVEEFNSQVLLKRSLYGKFQSNDIQLYKYHKSISWLSISLNYEDAQALRHEPIVWTPICCSDEIRPSKCFSKIFGCCGEKRFV